MTFMKNLGTLCTALALHACASGTGGALVEIEMEMVAVGQADDPPGRFETRTGYEVQLEEATLSVASILTYAPERRTAWSWERLLCGRARAHGGYDPFNGRIVRAEYAEPLELDLLSTEPTALGRVLAETGPMDSASVLFGDQVRGDRGQAHVRGTAQKDGVRTEFEGTLQIEDQALLRRVDGIPVEGVIEAGGTFRLAVRPHVLFDEAHFDRLEADAEGIARLTPETQVHTGWVFGVRSTRAYESRWKKP